MALTYWECARFGFRQVASMCVEGRDASIYTFDEAIMRSQDQIRLYYGPRSCRLRAMHSAEQVSLASNVVHLQSDISTLYAQTCAPTYSKIFETFLVTILEGLVRLTFQQSILRMITRRKCCNEHVFQKKRNLIYRITMDASSAKNNNEPWDINASN